MRILALITMAGGVACGAMAGWGMFTDAGRRHFDEMAGIIPLAAGALSIAALTAGAIAYAIALRSDRRRRGFEVGLDERGESHQSKRAPMTTKIPATVKELQALLVARKLYPHYAAADGTDPYDGYGLKWYDNAWMVYRSGHMSGMKAAFFDNEQDAVKELIDRLRKYGFAEAVADID